ncbi:MAG: hypothetical protein Q8Q01_03775 [archaeon]|nr:hypothetical protein [archaeon]
MAAKKIARKRMPAKVAGRNPAKSFPNPQKNKLWVVAAITLILVVVLVAVFLRFQTQGAGQAIYVGDVPVFGPANLAVEDVAIIRNLPATTQTVQLILPLHPFDENPLEYNFILTKVNNDEYNIEVRRGEVGIFARDTLFVSRLQQDNLMIHIDRDGLPDLEVAYANRQITLSSPHFISPDSVVILLQNESGVIPSIIKLDEGQVFSAQINASSLLIAPDIAVSPGGVLNIVKDNNQNLTLADFTYTAPAQSTAVLLDITGSVPSGSSHTYYTFAVGNVVYALQQQGFPEMNMTLVGDGSQADFSVKFAATTALQPFAVPCSLVNNEFNILFDNSFDKVYGYNAQRETAEVWNSGDAPDELTNVEEFSGYFVKLATADEKTVTVRCNVDSIKPISNLPAFNVQMEQLQLVRGWNLFSLQGVVPRPITDFAITDNFVIFECKQGYDCSELPPTTSLMPGKPYWVFVDQPTTLRFIRE